MQAFIMISHSSLDQKRSLISLAVLLACLHLHFFMPPFAASSRICAKRARFRQRDSICRSLAHLRHAPRVHRSTYLLDLACCWGAGVEGYPSTFSSNQGQKLNAAEPSMVKRTRLD